MGSISTSPVASGSVSWTDDTPPSDATAPSGRTWSVVAISADGLLMAASDGLVLDTQYQGGGSWIQQPQGPGANAIAITGAEAIGAGPGISVAGLPTAWGSGPGNPGTNYQQVFANGTGPYAFTPNDGIAKYSALIISTANTYHLDADMLARQIMKESAYKPDIVSPAGAKGIMQFMPGTVHDLHVGDPMNPWSAIPSGAAFDAQLTERFNGNLGAALAGYNMGQNGFAGWLNAWQAAGKPPITPTTGAVSGTLGTISQETWDYSYVITGRNLNQWLVPGYSLIAGGAGGVFLSRNAGQKWIRQSPSLASPVVAISVDGLYAVAADGASLWTYN